MRVFVTGGTGLIGRRLVPRLTARGDAVVLLTRDRQKAETAGLPGGPQVELVKGDPTFTSGAWREAVAGCDAAVNLAGENIFARRWSDEQKARIRESRLLGTRNVVAAIGAAPADKRPKVLVSGSAVGYYGPHDDDALLNEDAHPGQDFLAKLCVEWEEAARGGSAHGVRVVVLRLGVVLDPDGGALAQMAAPFKMFVGGPVVPGLFRKARQWFSWIHVEDAVGLIVFALDNAAVRGPMNAVAPAPLRMEEFCKELGSVLRRPCWLPVPRFALRVALGEVADILATGQRVVPAAAERHEYMFHYPTARPALEAIFAGAPAS